MSNNPLAHLSGSTIELLISCTGLADLDEFTKSDPMCVLFYKQFGQWKEFGRTEAIRDTLNPKFVESFMLDYEQDLQQALMFSIYDIDSRSTDLKHHDFVGSVELSLSSLLDPLKTCTTVCKTLRVPGDPRARGMINITAEVVRPSKNKVSVHAAGHKLVKTGKIIMSKPDVYMEISRSIDSISYHPVYRTETVHRSQNPRWRPFELSLQRLCNGNWDRLIQFSCWHHSGTGDYKMIGRKVTTLREINIMKKQGHFTEVVLVPKKDNVKHSVKVATCGCLRFFQFRLDCHYSLLDFYRGGLQIYPIIGIDFTSSNGRATDKLSLHNISGHRENQYISVLESLCAMISEYNREQKLSLLGFGAKLPKSDKTSHCFPLCPESVYVYGTKSAITYYKTSVEKLQFSGPTRIKKIIAMAESLAVKQPTQDNQLYHVLIIITDGVINDIDDAIERIVSISHLPLSIIFVGVGPADFSLMEIFNYYHERPLSLDCHGSNTSCRRNTHFVEYHRDNTSTGGNQLVARDAFAVLSTQIIEFMKSKDITPNRPNISMDTNSASLSELIEMNGIEQGSLKMSRPPSSLSDMSLKFSEKSGEFFAKLYKP